MSLFIFNKLTDEETFNGQIFSDLQLKVLQNELSAIAERILTLTYDPLNPVDFAQQDAFNKGQLQLIQYLMARSDESKQVLVTAAQSASNQF